MEKIFIFLLFASGKMQAQELFAFTEPASNMPSHSVGARLSAYLSSEEGSGRYYTNLVPELMWGANKNLMIHADAFVNN